MYRQGDVLLVPVDRDLFAAEPQHKLVVHSVVLALGEQTGHSHVLEGEVALYDAGFRIDQRDGTSRPRLKRPETITPEAIRFVEVLREGCSLIHQEHGAHVIPPGLYQVVRQRVYEAEDRAAYVAD
jgi:hypothetical protein